MYNDCRLRRRPCTLIVETSAVGFSVAVSLYNGNWVVVCVGECERVYERGCNLVSGSGSSRLQ